MPRNPNTMCSVCGVSIYRRPSELLRCRKAYCSRKCQGATRSSFKLSKLCTFCGLGFETPTYNRPRKYCSATCSNKARRGMRYTGEKILNYRSRLLIELQTLSGIQVCMVAGCGYGRTLDLHRVHQGKDGGEYTPTNTFALCPNHHAEVHRKVIRLVVKGPFQLEAEDTGAVNQLTKYKIK